MKYFFVIIFSALFFVLPVKAAELELRAATSTFGFKQEFKVDVVLKNPEEAVNAVAVRLSFPQDLLAIKRIDFGNSLINFWVEKPRIDGETVYFSGIIPGGLVDYSSTLGSMVFTSKETNGSGKIEIKESTLLKNDGQGSQVQTELKNFSFVVDVKAGVKDFTFPETDDKYPPESFTLFLSRQEEMFDNKYFLAFSTADKNSGIDYYAVGESNKRGYELENGEIVPPADIHWQQAESPFIVSDQTLSSYIFVKAVDEAGNYRIARLSPIYPPHWYQNYKIFAIVIITLVLSFFLFKKFYGRRK